MKRVLWVLMAVVCYGFVDANETYYQFSENDLEQLNSLYYDCNGEGWVKKEGWPITGDKFLGNTVFDGITYKSNGKLIESTDEYKVYELKVEVISLEKNMLSGILPNLDLKDLVVLELNLNSLFGAIPSFVLPELKHLILDNNRLTGEIPELELPKLKTFSVNRNNLSGLLPEFDIKTLTVLKFSENSFSGSLPNYNLPELTELYVFSNNLSGSLPNFNLPSLIEFEASNNKFDGELPEYDKLTLIQDIKLNNNLISGSLKDWNFPKAKDIQIGINLLSGNIPDFNLPELKTLILADNNLEGSIPKFTNMKQLEYLRLTDNKLEGEVPIFDMPMIKNIFLSRNKLSSFEDHKGIKNIIAVLFSENKFTFNELEMIGPEYETSFILSQDTILPLEILDGKIKVIAKGEKNIYNWYLNGTLIPGDINEVKLVGSGLYSCVVENSTIGSNSYNSELIYIENGSKKEVKYRIKTAEIDQLLKLYYENNGTENN